MDYKSRMNPKILEVKPSGIRRFFSLAEEMEDVISLGVGEPDFLTPWSIRHAGIENLKKGKTRYTANAGMMELRREICRYYHTHYQLDYQESTDVLVTVGGSEGIDMMIRTMIEAGDEVLVPEPSFVCYTPIVQMCGGVPVPIVTKAEDKFKLTPEALAAAITPKTKLLIMPYPNNPTGGVMRRDDLEKIAEVIRRTDIMVLSDEIYSALTYGDIPHVSIASMEGMQERTVVVNGFSKTYSMTGWRLGYALGPAPIIEQMTKLHQFAIMSAPTTSQYAAIEALRNGDEETAKMREKYDARRRFTMEGFRSMGLDCFEPEGAFYLFPCIRSTGLTSEEFCERLIQSQRVAVVPGNAFGQSGEGFIRVSYCYSIANIKEALHRIECFLNEIKGDSQ